MKKYSLVVFLALCLCISFERLAFAQTEEEGIKIEGVTNGILVFKYTPWKTLQDGKFVTTMILPEENNALVSRAPDSTNFRTPVTESAFSTEQQKILYFLASVKKKGEEIVHSSSLTYVKVDHLMPSPKTVVLQPLISSDGKVVEGHILLGVGSDLVIDGPNAFRSLLAQPDCTVILEPKVVINVEGVRTANDTDKQKKYKFVLVAADGKIKLQAIE